MDHKNEYAVFDVFSLKDAAVWYARHGYAVFPCHGIIEINGQAACTCSRGLSCNSPGKHPRTAHGVRDASSDVSVVAAWWDRWPDSNVAIATGAKSGFVVLDVDPRHGGDRSLRRLALEFYEPPTTVTVITGGDGEHRYFQMPEFEVRNSAGAVGDGLDVRGDGGYVIAPPSRHVSGKRYSFAKGRGPDELELAPCPDWLTSERTATTQPVAAGATDVVGEGGRNQLLASLAGTMRRRGMGIDAITAALLAENLARCSPALPEEEVVGIARSISRYPAESADHEDDSAVVIGTEVPGPVRELLGKHRRLQTLFAGTGTPEFDESGKRLDATPEGYDQSVVVWLAKHGITQGSDLATALSVRPDGHAKARGRDYILGKVRAAQTLAGGTGGSVGNPGALSAALGVKAVRIFKCDPPRYELQIEDVWRSFNSDQMLSSAAFKKRFFEHTHTLPSMPKGKNAAAAWEACVELWMRNAQRIAMPSDGTGDGAMRAAVRRSVHGLQIGESIEDLEFGKGFVLGADVIFKTDAVVRQVKATFDKPRIEDVVRHLFGMGLTYKTRRFAPGSGGTVKAWAKKPSTPGAANGPQQSSPTASVPPAQVATETHNDDLPPPAVAEVGRPSDNPDFSLGGAL